MSTERRQRTYGHRLVRLVRETGDATIATGIGVPCSTVPGWVRRTPDKVYRGRRPRRVRNVTTAALSVRFLDGDRRLLVLRRRRTA